MSNARNFTEVTTSASDMDVAILRPVGLNWPGVRRGLAELYGDKDQRNMEAFARLAGVRSRTVRRILEEPGSDAEIKVSTIDGWLRAVGSRLTVGAFLHKFEKEIGSVTTTLGDTSGGIDEVAHGPRAASGTAISPTAADRALLGSLAFALLRALNHPAALVTVDDIENDEPEAGEESA